jgi:hypothetical protein
MVQLINLGSNNGSDDGLFWRIGSSATLGTNTLFEGNILADQSITLNTMAKIQNGRALAQIGAVTMDTNIIENFGVTPYSGSGFSGGLEFDVVGNIVPVSGASAPIPEPSSILQFSFGLITIGFLGFRRKIIL